MASEAKLKSSNGGRESVKRRKVGFAADHSPISCSPNECMTLHLVSFGSHEGHTFGPEFSERIFGEEGKIYGYKGLKIDLWLHPTTFNAYVDIRYGSKNVGGKKPCTDVLAKLKEVFGDGLTDERDKFFSSMQAYSQAFEKMLTDHGEVVFEKGRESRNTPLASRQNDSPSNKNFVEVQQIVRIELKDEDVKAWHARLTPLCILFIEGAQPIEANDPLWEVYLALEGEGPHMKVVGFCNVYRFYCYPESTRLRISQILVLPPHQGKGFGLHLLEVVNTAAIQRSCYDVTMEEPSIALQKLRDTMDVVRLLCMPSANPAIQDALVKLHSKKEVLISAKSAEVSDYHPGALACHGNTAHEHAQSSRKVKAKGLLTPASYLVEEVRKKLKINKMQFRRCWEQLLFMYLDPNDKDLHDIFQEALVERLNMEIFDKGKENGSLSKQVVDTENQYDSSKTFVMIPKRIDNAVGSSLPLLPLHAADRAEHSDMTPRAEEKGTVLEQELQERELELLAVAQDVSRHCEPLGLTLPFSKPWDPEIPNQIVV